ncbi:MAG: hypothetical protein PHS52_02750 [Desulfotomaculaceae bacterium]|nr:hypothetical protein [Desulfotomaculaceae bacterium]
MKKKNQARAGKITWHVWAVIALGAVVFALPVPEKVKIFLAIPLYAAFIYVYYKYVYKKRSS